MNYETRALHNKLRKVAKSNAKRIREEAKILALYKQIELQQLRLSELQDASTGLHVNMRTPLPFTCNGGSK